MTMTSLYEKHRTCLKFKLKNKFLDILLIYTYILLKLKKLYSIINYSLHAGLLGKFVF
jgi:hypothetical protein